MNSITNTISISLFNDNTIDKIFEDVKATGAKVVMKDDLAECILISPKEYEELMEEINDARLLSLATKRLENYEPSKLIDGDDVFRNLGITDDDLKKLDGN